MSFCQNCGNEVSSNAMFCSHCGSSINTANDTQKETPKVLLDNSIELANENELSSPIKGTVQTLSLRNTIFEISEDMDSYNSYRKRFRKLAKSCSDNAVNEYLNKIHNLDEFLENFEDIYFRNLKILTNKSIDILVMEGIYSITHDDFLNEHISHFNGTLEFLNAIIEQCKQTVETNSRVSSTIMGGIQSVAGSMISKHGTNIAFFDSLFDGIVEGIAENTIAEASKMSEDQKIDLYNRITPHLLFNTIFYDYWNVHRTLVAILIQNGCNIYLPTNDMVLKANNIFENLSNPHFDKEKLVDALLGVIKTYPYNEKYYEFMKNEFGETEDVVNIIKYYSCDVDKTVYSETDYPKIEATKTIQAENENSNSNLSNDVLGKLNINTGAVKNVLKSASESTIGKSLFNKFKK